MRSWIFLLAFCVLSLDLSARSTSKTRALIDEAKKAYLDENYITARKYYQQACSLGDYLGCSGVGTMYERGLGVVKDFIKAREYYTYACEYKDAFGCFSKAMLENGESAVDLYSSGCNNEDGRACLALGNIYYKGKGVVRNPKNAVKYYEKACSFKSAEGCFNLGIIYQIGDKKIDINEEYAYAYFVLARQYWEDECQAKNQGACKMLHTADEFRILEP